MQRGEGSDARYGQKRTRGGEGGKFYPTFAAVLYGQGEGRLNFDNVQDINCGRRQLGTRPRRCHGQSTDNG